MNINNSKNVTIYQVLEDNSFLVLINLTFISQYMKIKKLLIYLQNYSNNVDIFPEN